MEKITCKCCGVSKQANSSNFYWRNDSNKWRQICLDCISKKRKIEYNLNKEDVLAKATKYRDKNRDKIKQFMTVYNSRLEVKKRMAEYRKNNRKSLREKEKEWRKNNPEKAKEIAKRKSKKRSQNPIVRIRQNVSRGIGLALRRNGSSKAGDSVMNHLDFTIHELKIHLESLFESWMTWSNYGSYKLSNWNDNDPSTWTWQIDHVIPQSETPYDSMEHPNFKKCWKLSNLRPLSSKKNCIDGCTRARHEK